MHKKFFMMCIAFSVVCHATVEEQSTSRWDRCVAYLKKVKRIVASGMVVGLMSVGVIFSESAKKNARDAAFGSIQEGYELNKEWVSFLKQRPEADFAPLVEKLREQVLSETAKFKQHNFTNLKEHLSRLLDTAQKLPGNFLIDKAFNEDIPLWYNRSVGAYLCGIAFVGSIAYLTYEIVKLLQQDDEQDPEQWGAPVTTT